MHKWFMVKQLTKNPTIPEKLGVKVKAELHLDSDEQTFIIF